ncbi:MAG: hypothetical protein ACRDPV_01725 [Gaiellaceae bacterium]
MTMTRVLTAWTLFSIAVCLIVGAAGEYLEAKDCANPDALCIGHGWPMFFVFFVGFWFWLVVAGAIVLVGLLVRFFR